MLMREKESTSLEITEKYNEAYSWFSDVIPDIEKTRLKVYKDNLEIINQQIDKENRMRIDFDKSFIFNTFFEVSRLIGISRMLKSFNKNHLPKGKIREMASDPVYSKDEDDANTKSNSRNIQFEFELATFLFDNGAPVLNFEDVTIGLGNYSLSYQCKRPAKGENLSSHFKSAAKQLHRFNSGNPRNYHAIAISLEKVFGLTGKWYEFEEINGVVQDVHRQITEIRKKTDLLEDLVSESKCILVDYCCRIVAWNKATSQFNPIFLSQPLRLNYKTGRIHKDEVWNRLQLLYEKTVP